MDSLDVLLVELVGGKVALAGWAVELRFPDVGLDVEFELLFVTEGSVTDGAAFFGDFSVVQSEMGTQSVGLGEGLAADVADKLLLVIVTSHVQFEAFGRDELLFADCALEVTVVYVVIGEVTSERCPEVVLLAAEVTDIVTRSIGAAIAVRIPVTIDVSKKLFPGRVSASAEVTHLVQYIGMVIFEVVL